MSNLIVGIFRGQTFATADGDQVTVVELAPKSGFAVVENLEDTPGVMHLADMLEAIQRGLLVNIDEEIENTEDV